MDIFSSLVKLKCLASVFCKSERVNENIELSIRIIEESASSYEELIAKRANRIGVKFETGSREDLEPLCIEILERIDGAESNIHLSRVRSYVWEVMNLIEIYA
jgi:hypothetical protein